MHRLDENSAAEISGLLGYIRDLQRRFDVAIILVHHASKKQRSQPGQALRGSSDLHAIGDCNAYLARNGQHLVLTLEHRAAASPEPMLLELDVHRNGTCLRVVKGALSESSTPSLDDQILDALRSAHQPLPRGVLRAQLRVNNKRLGDALRRLDEGGKVRDIRVLKPLSSIKTMVRLCWRAFFLKRATPSATSGGSPFRYPFQ